MSPLQTTLRVIIALLPILPVSASTPPIVVHTWSGPFTVAADAAWSALLNHPRTSTSTSTSTSVVLDAVQAGLSACEQSRCDGTVGYGGSPDETCETTLDAMIMDGTTMDVGAVGALRRIKDAVAVARHVLEHTRHTLLVGDSATRFAVESGFREENLTTAASAEACAEWTRRGCQPNSRLGVEPDPRTSCGPYSPLDDRPTGTGTGRRSGERARGRGHDTIALVALDADGAMAAGTTTNGKAHKVPGRVGDGPIAGSGSYVDADVGGCGATGDGDIMMRFLPCYQAVESMRRAMSPLEAAEDAVLRMVSKYPGIHAGLVLLNNKGEHAAAASNWQFSYSFRGANMNRTQVVMVNPIYAMPSTSSEL